LTEKPNDNKGLGRQSFQKKALTKKLNKIKGLPPLPPYMPEYMSRMCHVANAALNALATPTENLQI
tara:strand:+ start:287 stop:484 length:198 start_codon:yes stop_codon:yes gene_type:complete